MKQCTIADKLEEYNKYISIIKVIVQGYVNIYRC